MFGIENNTEFLTAIGIANAPAETKAKLIAGLENLAAQKLIIKLSDKLTDEQAQAFSAIEDQQEAYNWLRLNVPDLMTIISDILSEMKDDILLRKQKVVG